MQRIVVFLIFMGMSLGMAFAQNALMSVKVIPLPQEKVRIDFEFAHPIKQQPSSFVTQNPARTLRAMEGGTPRRVVRDSLRFTQTARRDAE